MKTLKFRFLSLSLFLGFTLFLSQAVFAQENKCHEPISLNEIFEKFKSYASEGKSIEQSNKKMIDEIVERKINFKLTRIEKKSLKKAGANDLFLKIAFENRANYTSKRECLYQKYIDNYRSDDPEKLKIALEAIKEYFRNCEFVDCDLASEENQFFEKQIRVLENAIESKSASLSQENTCLSFYDVLDKLTQRDSKTTKQINKELAGEIQKRKVNFSLTYSQENALKNGGANSLLIDAIRENSFDGLEEASDIYKIFIETQERPEIEDLKKLLEAYKNYVAKFEKEKCYAQEVSYFKEAIPTLEKAIERKIKNDEIKAKDNYKYGLLNKITEAYKIKDWNNVFSIGEKVLEVDPEFTPLLIVLAGVGFEQAKLKGDRSEFNNETIRYAELAVKLLEAEKENKNKYGAFDYEYKTKAEALGKMKEILDFMKNSTNQ